MSSLPVPLSPVINTVLFLAATMLTALNTSITCLDLPITCSTPYLRPTSSFKRSSSFDIKRFRHVVKRAGAFGREGRARGVESGQHDDLAIAIDRSNLLQDRETVRARHHDVQQHDIRRLIGDFLDSLIRG